MAMFDGIRQDCAEWALRLMATECGDAGKEYAMLIRLGAIESSLELFWVQDCLGDEITWQDGHGKLHAAPAEAFLLDYQGKHLPSHLLLAFTKKLEFAVKEYMES